MTKIDIATIIFSKNITQLFDYNNNVKEPLSERLNYPLLKII